MAEENAESEIIYIFKSTWYPELRQKILSLLSLPNDLKLIVEFDEKWLSTNIKSNLRKCEGKSALVIFLDFASAKLDFYPLRKCRILEIIPPVDGVTYQVVLSLNDFTIPNDEVKFNSHVRQVLAQSNLLTTDSSGNEWQQNLVILADSSIISSVNSGNSQEKVWEQIIENLAKRPPINVRGKNNQSQFADSVFFRTRILPRKNLKTPSYPKEHVFRFKEGTQYTVGISVYNSNFQKATQNEMQEIVIDYDSNLVDHVGCAQLDLPLGQRKYTKYFDFRTKEPLTGGESDIVIKGKRDSFETPSVQIPYVLLAPKNQMIAAAFCLAIGILILGIADTFAGSIVLWLNLKEPIDKTIWQIVIVIIGTILSAVPIIWLETKRR